MEGDWEWSPFGAVPFFTHYSHVHAFCPFIALYSPLIFLQQLASGILIWGMRCIASSVHLIHLHPNLAWRTTLLTLHFLSPSCSSFLSLPCIFLILFSIDSFFLLILIFLSIIVVILMDFAVSLAISWSYYALPLWCFSFVWFLFPLFLLFHFCMSSVSIYMHCLLYI